MTFLDDPADGQLDIETIRSSVSCRYLAEYLGLEVIGDKTFCLDHAERTPSVHLYDDHVYAFCCGKGGDVIDLYSWHTGASFRKALQDLAKLAGFGDLEPGTVKERVKPPLPDFTEELESKRLPAERHGLHDFSRHTEFIKRQWPGINPAITLHQWMVPFEGGFLIPHRHDGKVVGVKVRHFDGSKSAWPGSVFTTQLYEARHDPMSPGGGYTERAVICEGESDAWAMASHAPNNLDVYALPSGAGCWKPEWIEQQLGQYTRIWVITDNDRAGSEALNKICGSIGYERAIPMAVPQLYSDVNEALGKSQWRPEFKP